jgi:hypothetical protein
LEDALKHVRQDQTFIYYYQRRPSGTLMGIRVAHSHAWVFEGNGDDPERVPVDHRAHPLPMSSIEAPHCSEGFLNVYGPVVDEHPELQSLLTGQITFEQALVS